MALVAGTLIHSIVATRRDSFTIDEPYHITAGVSYIKTGDFRINPEHPPLVKLWTGAFLAATGFHLPLLRQYRDKPDERAFTADAVFLRNDYASAQRRSRIAMWAHWFPAVSGSPNDSLRHSRPAASIYMGLCRYYSQVG